jgi:hypothetical protein
MNREHCLIPEVSRASDYAIHCARSHGQRGEEGVDTESADVVFAAAVTPSPPPRSAYL